MPNVRQWVLFCNLQGRYEGKRVYIGQKGKALKDILETEGEYLKTFETKEEATKFLSYLKLNRKRLPNSKFTCKISRINPEEFSIGLYPRYDIEDDFVVMAEKLQNMCKDFETLQYQMLKVVDQLHNERTVKK